MNELITIVNDKALLDSEMVQSLILVEKQIKELKEIQDTYKKTIKEAMEAKNIIKLLDEITGLSITYISAQNNLEKFNKEKFQEENPELYDQYVTMDGKKSEEFLYRKNELPKSTTELEIGLSISFNIYG